MPVLDRSLVVAAGLVGALAASGAFGAPALPKDPPEWAAAMAAIHGRFDGRPGTFAQFGDSITDTLAFWAPLPQGRRNASTELEHAYQVVEEHMLPECWRGWKGPEFGNQGGQTTRWAEQNVDAWLSRLNPEVALIMFGTNDLPRVEPDEYRDRLRSVVRRCLDNGTVVILSTIPPRHGFEPQAAAFAEVAREVARECSVPLIDYHAEILERRPDDWNGALDRFRDFEGYDVPTLLARDGVHPSNPKADRGDYSEEALRRHGFNLRNALVLMTYGFIQEQRPSFGVAGVERSEPPGRRPLELGARGARPQPPRSAILFLDVPYARVIESILAPSTPE